MIKSENFRVKMDKIEKFAVKLIKIQIFRREIDNKSKIFAATRFATRWKLSLFLDFGTPHAQNLATSGVRRILVRGNILGSGFGGTTYWGVRGAKPP